MPTVKLHLWTPDPSIGWEIDMPAGWPVPNLGEAIHIADHPYAFHVKEKALMLEHNEIWIIADDERMGEKN